MKRVRMVVAYDGTNYHGWQIQKNGITVEEVLNDALTKTLGEAIEVIGSSRTDAGVHALGNVCIFDTNTPIPAEKISYAVNQRLPEDIRVQKSEEVSSDWHPRHVDSIKTYEYRIYRAQIPMPTKRLYAHFTYTKLDVDKMREACTYIVGEHDFSAFCGAGAQVDTKVRTVYSLEIAEEGAELVIRISGNGFLYNMVRIIAGTLMEVGRGAIAPAHVKDIIEGMDRNNAGPTAPACGLTLIGYRYPDEEKM